MHEDARRPQSRCAAARRNATCLRSGPVPRATAAPACVRSAVPPGSSCVFVFRVFVSNPLPPSPPAAPNLGIESPPMRKIRWGVLGVAKIATEKVIPAMQRGQWSEVTAIASRDLEKASAAAATLGIAEGLRILRGPARRRRTSTPSTIRCRTICTCRGRSRRPSTASTCSARSPSRSRRTRHASSWRCAIAPARRSRKRSWSARTRSG